MSVPTASTPSLTTAGLRKFHEQLLADLRGAFARIDALEVANAKLLADLGHDLTPAAPKASAPPAPSK